MSQTLPMIEVMGCPAQRGQAHGEAFRDLIRIWSRPILKIWRRQREDA